MNAFILKFAMIQSQSHIFQIKTQFDLTMCWVALRLQYMKF